MTFTIKLSGKTLYTIMRECNYVPESSSGNEMKFHRLLAGRPYPKFHLYCALLPDQKSAQFNLHLDQKQPSYKGSHAHSGEYDGPLVEQEAARIQNITESAA